MGSNNFGSTIKFDSLYSVHASLIYYYCYGFTLFIYAPKYNVNVVIIIQTNKIYYYVIL